MALSNTTLRAAVREAVEAAEPRNRPFQTALTNTPGTAGTTFSVADGDAFQVGDYIETPDGELALVTAIATNDLTVTRNIGTSGAENLSSGDLIRKNPRFTLDQIDAAMEDIVYEMEGHSVFNLAAETIAFTTDDWYNLTATDATEVYSAWYLDSGEFRVPFYTFVIDPANTQPQIYLATPGWSGNIYINYRAPYASYTEMPDRLRPMMVAGIVYKLLGGAAVVSTTDPGKRTDRTVQGGQETRDSYWWYREFVRLRDIEVAHLREQVKRLPKNRLSQRARRFIT